MMYKVLGSGILRHENGNVGIAETCGPQSVQCACDCRRVAKDSKNCRIFSSHKYPFLSAA
jgi:hypothetical protein